MTSDLVGARLGPYEVVDFIGYGGMAEVYKGYHPELDRYVAIKVVGRHMEADPVFNARFRREAKAVAQLRHPNIVQVYDFGETGGGHYMVMEYVEGPTLSDLIAHRRLALDDITFIIRQVASALDHAHSHGVVHRDVKPSNIMITRSSQAILTDFGLAMLVGRQAGEETGGRAFGTPGYMAPEQVVDSRAATLTSDIYSLGVILYQMLTGQLPFTADDAVDMALRHLNETAPDPRFLNPDIPAAVAQVTLKALSKDPAGRFAGAMQFASALERAAAPEPDRSTIVRRKKPAPPAEPPPVKRGPTKAEERRAKREARREQRQRERRTKREQKKPQQERPTADAAVVRRSRQTQRPKLAGRLLSLGLVLAAVGLVCLAGVLTLQSLGLLPGGGLSLPLSGIISSPTLPPPPPSPSPTLPEPTPLPSPTPLQPAEATSIPPMPVVPLEVGSQALRIPDGMIVQFVPAGEFLMGTDDSRRNPHEQPQHLVVLSAYWIDQTEVTNAQFRLCVEVGLCRPPTHTAWYDDLNYADLPVTSVNYEAAVAYCLWLAGETGQVIGLPTEAQWEKAASWDPIASVKHIYPWGDEDPVADMMRYSAGGTTYMPSPVGNYPVGISPYGALDMAGNVWEWVADWYDPTYYQATGIPTDPSGPMSGQLRILRGGSWSREENYAITTVRFTTPPTTTGSDIGFRCAMSVERPAAESGIVLTPLEALDALLNLLDQARTNPANNRGELDAWVETLGALRTALENDDNVIARTLLEGSLAQLYDEEDPPQLDPVLTYRMTRALLWILAQVES